MRLPYYARPLMRRLLRRAAIAVAIMLPLAALGLIVYLRASLPVVAGTLTVTGPDRAIEIIRDRDAIPHILASTRGDALFGLGYVHAQDRLWQMEFQRRIAHGRLAEIFGEIAVPQDRFLRTIGIGKASESAWRNLDESTRRDVDAYIAGVNAVLANARGRRLPPEFTLLGITPEPWSGPDVIGWIKMMAWDLSENYEFELLRADLHGRLGVNRAADLLLPYPENGPSIVTEPLTPGQTGPGVHSATSSTPAEVRLKPDTTYDSQVRLEPDATFDNQADTPRAPLFADALAVGHPVVARLLGGGAVEGIGSNNWVLSGSRTASGHPILANDPHLGTRLPSTWYLAHLSGGDLDVIGATLPGVPGVATGRNRHIAWGVTNVGADVQDLYREQLSPNGTAALFEGEFEPLTIVTETIRVRDAEPVAIQVRRSRHGPLISDAINANLAGTGRPGVEPLAFQWTALAEVDTTLPAFMAVNVARNWSEFTRALEQLMVPAQNFVYADVDGRIGYYAPGRIPIRARGDGSVPAEGWTGEMEWTGFVPFDELPHAFDPPEGFVVTANHRPMPPAYPHLIALEYPEPYRATRITALVRQSSHATVDDMRSIQADTRSSHAEALLPLLLARVSPADDRERQAVSTLQGWDYEMAGDEGPGAIFAAWFFAVIAEIAGDDLGADLTARYQGHFSYATRFLTTVLARNDESWCDRSGTPVQDTCGDVVTAALRAALADLEERIGERERWRWDAVHVAVFPHQALDGVWWLRSLVSRRVPGAGDWSTVNAGPASVDPRYEQRAGAGYRQIVDLRAGGESRFADAIGQSGHPLSPHYDDYLADWRAVSHRPMRMDRADIEAGAIGHLRLEPAK